MMLSGLRGVVDMWQYFQSFATQEGQNKEQTERNEKTSPCYMLYTTKVSEALLNIVQGSNTVCSFHYIGFYVSTALSLTQVFIWTKCRYYEGIH